MGRDMTKALRDSKGKFRKKRGRPSREDLIRQGRLPKAGTAVGGMPWEDPLIRALEGLSVEQMDVGLEMALPSIWAERNRWIGGRPWSFAGREYLIGMMDCRKGDVVFKCGRQVGKTQGWMNLIFHLLDFRAWSVLIVFPTGDEVSVFSKDRFTPAYEESPRLQELFSSVDNVHHKQTAARVGRQAANVYLRGSLSRSKLQSISVQKLVIDELDFCNEDNLKSAEECMSGHLERGTCKVSTPTEPEIGIEAEWDRSDQSHYFLKCPRCSEVQFMDWPDSVEWREGRADTARYRCKKCKRPWEWQSVRAMVARAADEDGLGWVPAYPGRDIGGFWLPQMYSPTVLPSKVVQDFELAQGNASAEADFHRFKIGKGFVSAGSHITREMVEAAKHRGGGQMKHSSIGAFMGIDVGVPVKHVDISEYPNGVLGNKHLLWAGEVTDWAELGMLMRQYSVAACVIDANPERSKVEEFRDEFMGRVFMAFYPNDTYLQRKENWNLEMGIVTMHRTYYLDQVTGRYRIGTVLLPRDVPEDYGNHHLNIVRVEKEDQYGNPVARWAKRGADHFAHAAAYCEAAARYFGGSMEEDLLPEDTAPIEEFVQMEELHGQPFF